MGRTEEAVCVSGGGGRPSADLGESSKYPSESLEGRRGERFPVSCIDTGVSRS